jgi:hypothetical protein
MVDVEMLQLSLLVDANVNVTEPADTSCCDGTYWPVKAVLEGENVPVPLVVQLPVVVPPVTEPAKVIGATMGQTT